MPVTFPVRLVSPTSILFDGEAEMVACRTAVGEIAFLAHHVPLVGALDVCAVRVMTGDGAAERVFAVKGGFAEVRDNRVTLLSDVAVPAPEIDAEYVERAREEAGSVGESAVGTAGGDAAGPGVDGGAGDEAAAAASREGERATKWVALLEELSRS